MILSFFSYLNYFLFIFLLCAVPLACSAPPPPKFVPPPQVKTKSLPPLPSLDSPNKIDPQQDPSQLPPPKK